MDITIKKMETDSEIKGKAFVHWRSWHDAYRGIVDDSYLEKLTLEKCEEMAYRWTENIIVAKDGDRVVGFAGYGTSRDDDLDGAGEIFAIYILSDYYGHGVGYRLMKEAVARLEDHDRIAVWVLKENERAIRFYERFGYRFDGREETVTLGAPATEVRMILER